MIFPFPVSVNAVAATTSSSGGGGANFPWEMNGATWAGRGDDYTDTSLNNPGTGANVRRWNNRVSGSSLLIEQDDISFAPPIVRLDPVISGVNMGAAASLDDFDVGSSFDNYISGNQWHAFAVVNFDNITDGGGTLGHFIVGAISGEGSQPNLVTTAPWGIFLKEISGQNYAVGYMYNGTTTFSVSGSIAEDEFTLIEFYSDGSTMGIRTNASASSEVAISGNIDNLSGRIPRIGSKFFNGSWEITTNRCFEISLASEQNSDVTNVRSYFGTRYSIST